MFVLERSVREDHQPRIEHDREEYMAPSDDRERENDGPIDSGDLPSRGYQVGRENNHHREQEEADDERQPKAAQNPRDLDEEVGPLDLLLGCAPRDVIRE